jgi:histidinol dehydrogenase
MREIKPVTVEYARQFDAPQFEAHFLKVTQADFNYARAQLEPSLILAIEQAHDNIQKFHQQQMPDPMWFTEARPGIMAGEKVTPITSVGLYVPRGKVRFPRSC